VTAEQHKRQQVLVLEQELQQELQQVQVQVQLEAWQQHWDHGGTCSCHDVQQWCVWWHL
jgi:hypothetical protein